MGDECYIPPMPLQIWFASVRCVCALGVQHLLPGIRLRQIHFRFAISEMNLADPNCQINSTISNHVTGAYLRFQTRIPRVAFALSGLPDGSGISGIRSASCRHRSQSPIFFERQIYVLHFREYFEIPDPKVSFALP